MAKITFKDSEDYSLFLGRYREGVFRLGITKKAVYAGAAIVADQIRANLEALPEDKFRRLRPGEKFSVVSAALKQELSKSFGLTKIKMDEAGFLHTKAGIEGYSRFDWHGDESMPLPMVARSIESGSSVRVKTPFVRPAVQATRKKAIAEMQKIIDEETESLHRR